MPRKSRDQFLDDEAAKAAKEDSRAARAAKKLAASGADPEREAQMREGRRRAALERVESFDEDDIHDRTRKILHAASQSAAETLLEATSVGGIDKNQIIAAGSVLDRTGHPPTRKIVNEHAKTGGAASDLLAIAVAAFAAMPKELKDAFFEALRSPARIDGGKEAREVIDIGDSTGTETRQLPEGSPREA